MSLLVHPVGQPVEASNSLIPDYPRSRPHGKPPGLTLVEVMMAMTIFTILAAGIIGAVMAAQNDAENNLYETTALTIAISFLEQMTSSNLQHLQNPQVNQQGEAFMVFILGSGQERHVPLGRFSDLDIPIISTMEGVAKKSLTIAIRPTITPSEDFEGYWLSVDYQWSHPRRDRTYEGTVRNMRSQIASF